MKIVVSLDNNNLTTFTADAVPRPGERIRFVGEDYYVLDVIWNLPPKATVGVDVTLLVELTGHMIEDTDERCRLLTRYGWLPE